MADGQVVFEITADASHAKANIKDVTRTIEQESQKWEDAAHESTGNISNSFGSMLKNIAVGFSAAKIGKALLDIGKEAINLASDLAEVQNVVDVTFGEAGAKKIETWAKAAGTQFGLTETQAKKFTSTLGAMMKSSGLAGDEIVEMSTDLAGLAADMASFYNLDFDTAFQKIRSGISGETEPLKQLGINMSVANLEAFALAQGLNKTFSEMSQGEQTMLRYQYIMQATSDAQGDFQRTSDGFANGVRQLETEMETLKTSVGTYLLPAVQEVVQSINSLFTDGEGREWTRRRTILDDVQDINAQTEATIQQINSTQTVVNELADSLTEIAGKKEELETATGNVVAATQGLAGLANELSKVKIEGDAKEAFTDTLGTLKENINGLSEVTGDDANGVKNWLGGVSEEAKKLTNDDVNNWGSLLGELTTDVPQLANATSAADGLSRLTTELSKVTITGDARTVIENTLPILRNNIDALSAITGQDAEGVEAFLSGVETEASKLSPDDVTGWETLLTNLNTNLPGLSEAYTAAGGVRQLASELSQVNINGDARETFTETLAVLYDNVDALSTIKGESAEGVIGWLNGVSEEAKKLSPDDANAWATLLGALVMEIPGVDDGEGGGTILERLASYYLALGTDSEEAALGLSALGFSTDEIEEKQRDWLATCKELVRTMPGLSEIIDVNTGEVKGGIPAIKAYADEWARAAKYEAEVGRIKEIREKYEGLPTQSEAAGKVRDKRAVAKAYLVGYGNLTEEQAEAVLSGAETFEKVAFGDADVLNEYGWTRGQKISLSDSGGGKIQEIALDYQTMMNNPALAFDFFYGGVPFQNKGINATKSGLEQINKAVGEYMDALYTYDEFLEVQPAMLKAYDEELNEVADTYGVTTEQVEADAQAMADAEKNMTKLEKAAKGDEVALQDVTSALYDADEALKALSTHVTSVREGILNSIDSVATGFEKIETPTQKVRRLNVEMEHLGARTEQNAEEWDKLNDELNKSTGTQVSAQSMQKGLESQSAYLEEYLANLNAARALGVSDEVLAALSDGSEESFDYLAALAEATPEQIEEINKAYAEVAAQKQALADELTKQQLTVDQTYQTMLEKAKEAVAGLDLGQEAAENAAKTVEGIGTGLNEAYPGVKDSVDSIIKELERLSGWGITFTIGSSGTQPEGSFATGIDFVPHDMLARIHEGEAVLTAEENKLWQGFKNGALSGVDYDQLGGVMRDNVKAGGNVYLDGRTVGAVISDQQGRSYRALQRSGWQQ